MKISRSVYDNKQHSPNFTSRIAPIRDAQWVCNTINTTFPHLSPTKFKIIFEHYIQKNGAKESVPVFKSYNDIYLYIKSQLNSKHESFFEKIKQKFCTTKFQKKMNTFAVIEKYMERISMLRTENKKTMTQLDGSINMLVEHKTGNCYELAILAELVTKLNGIKNSATCLFFDGNLDINKQITHAACVFNLDNTPVEKIINNKTIIIDPWLGKADFANNMIKHYKNSCADLLEFPQKSKVIVLPVELVMETPNELNKYKKEYPQLVFKSKDRKFMQKVK